MARSTSRKTIRFHILVDEPFKKMVDLAAHESWMSVGQYMRDIVALMDGANYDTAADLVMIGREVTLSGLESLREAAQRRSMSVAEFCESFTKRRAEEEEEKAARADAQQVSLLPEILT